MTKFLKNNTQTIFATGHVHSLQYFEERKNKYVVTRAGGKTDFVKRAGQASFAWSCRGYVKIDIFENRDKWANSVSIDLKTKKRNLSI